MPSTTLQFPADTWIDEQNQATTAGSATTMAFGTFQSGKTYFQRVSLLRFTADLGKISLSACALVLEVTTAAGAGAQQIAASRLATSFNPAAACWDLRDTATTWTSGDFSSLDYSTTSQVTQFVYTTTGVKSWTFGPTLGQFLYDNDGTLMRFCIRPTGTNFGNWCAINSANALSGQLPELNLTYTSAAASGKKYVASVISNAFAAAAGLGSVLSGGAILSDTTRLLYRGDGRSIHPKDLVDPPYRWRDLPECLTFGNYRKVIQAIRNGAPRKCWQALAKSSVLGSEHKHAPVLAA